MKVLIVEPLKAPVVREIDGSLEDYQKIVGGYIQAIYPFMEEPEVALICNDEGKLMNLPLNRTLKDENGQVYDILSGTCFLCGAPADSDHFTGLTDAQIRYFRDYYAKCEEIVRIGDQLMVLVREYRDTDNRKN